MILKTYITWPIRREFIRNTLTRKPNYKKKTIGNIYLNNECLKHKLTPNYANMKIKDTSTNRAAKKKNNNNNNNCYKY